MGGNQFLITIVLCFTLPISIYSLQISGNKLYDNPKDEVEFVNPHESETIAKAAAATETDDMNIPVAGDKIPSELVITTLEDMPFSGTVMDDGTLKGQGYAFYFLELLRAKMNFTYRIIRPRQNLLGDERFGVVGQLARKIPGEKEHVSNSRWKRAHFRFRVEKNTFQIHSKTSTIQAKRILLISKCQEVDMVVAFLPVIPELRNVIKYSVALDEAEWTILMKRPGESASGSGLLAPFDKNVWCLIIASVVAVGPIIYILIFLRFFFCKDGEPRKYSLATCMWFVYGALLKQGSTLSPVTDSARLLFATWWIFITILTSFYTANLTAFLTLSKFTLPINSAEDLGNTNLKWFARKGEAIDRVVNGEVSEELSMLRRAVSKGYGQFLDLSHNDSTDILRYIDQERMYIRERSHVRELIFNDYMNKTRMHVAEQFRCTYVIMPGNILTKSRAFAFQLNSTLDILFNRRLMSLVESGLVKVKTSSHLSSTKICPLNLESKERQLRNSDLTMTYIGMAIGFSVAVAAFFGEVIYLRIIKREKFSEDPQAVPKPPVYKFDGTKAVQRSPPPLYQNIQDYSKKQIINGRDYYIVRERDGEKRLVPVRTPSAFLFQYAA